MLKFNEGADAIRDEFGFNNTDPLKFALSDKPDHVSKENHTKAKEALLRLAKEQEVKTILYCASHKIIDSQGQENYLDMGITSVLTKLQQFCDETDEDVPFYCLVDRHSRKTFGPHLRKCFTDRNNQPKDGFNTPNLVGIGSTWDGTSHLSSLCDVVVGSYNYIVNNPHRDIAGKKLIRELRPLIWGKRNKVQKKFVATGRGLLFRPEVSTILHPPYKSAYIETHKRIIEWANDKSEP